MSSLDFLKGQGHRVCVEVSSSNFPSYARNLNTAQDLYTSTQVTIARNTVTSGAGRSSKIALPVAASAESLSRR
jgi:predicted acyl esterase